MASMNINSLLMDPKTVSSTWTTTKRMFPIGEGYGDGGKGGGRGSVQKTHRIVDKEYGRNSISHLMSQMLADNVSTKVVEDIKLAQVMTASPDKLADDRTDAESAQFNSIMKCAYRHKTQMTKHELEDKQAHILIEQTAHLHRTLAKRELVAKNKKRNAKRRAKAKATKKALNFTPTTEQEKDVEEWFWGEPPEEVAAMKKGGFHDSTEYGSDGFPTEEEYDRKEIELGGPVIHCGGGRWKLG